MTFPRCLSLLFLGIQVLYSAVPVPATVTLEGLSQTYDGSAKSPTVVTTPPGLPAQVVYRDLSPGAVPSSDHVVYNDTPSPLAPSYFSYSFHAQQLTALGNYIQLGGTSRELKRCEVVMVTWAKAADWPALAAQNPAGYLHPISIALYGVKSNNELVFLTEANQQILIPWRPTTKPDGSPYAFNGFAFRASISFPGGIVLPERVLPMVSFDTQFSGFSPTGSDGPFNSLNVASKNTHNVAPVGSDLNPDAVLQIWNGSWFYPALGWHSSSAPMIRLIASSNQTTTPPTQAGSWRATATVSDADYRGSRSDEFEIQKAPATLLLGNLRHVADGMPKSISITTQPPGLAVTATYDGSSTVPSSIGTYTVEAAIADPNHQGSANAELWIGNDLQSWIAPWVINGNLPESAQAEGDDPDQDSLSNLMEYALALDPTSGALDAVSFGLPRIILSGNQLSLVYRKNLTATDLEYEVETATDPGAIGFWAVAETVEELIESDRSVAIVRATLQVPVTESGGFLRLKVTRRSGTAP